MLSRLKDRVCIITGAGQGIGRATARRLGLEGAAVLIADVSEEAARRTLGDLRHAFLASDDVGHVTGQCLSAGGGMNMM